MRKPIVAGNWKMNKSVAEATELAEGVKLDLAPKAQREREINYVLSNSFGFGGTNASLVMGKVDS